MGAHWAAPSLPCHPQASLWNFVRYNVVGGGESALYGVEGPSYYLRNGVNNFSLALPLALALPLVALLAGAPGASFARGLALRIC